MRRVLLIGLLTVATASLRSSPGFALAPAAPDASVRLTACMPALVGKDRSATFEARVRPAHASERMQLRFTLQVREAAPPGWRRVLAPGLDRWQTSAAGVSRYSYSKTVRNLSAPATYRTVVRFRWLDAEGHVLARARARSRACRQPDVRPDLKATRIAVARPLGTGRALYAVTLDNDGRTATGAFSVALRAGEEEADPLTIPGLDAGERRVLTFAGPACAPGTTLTVRVDPELAVDERDEGDNVLDSACPQ